MKKLLRLTLAMGFGLAGGIVWYDMAAPFSPPVLSSVPADESVVAQRAPARKPDPAESGQRDGVQELSQRIRGLWDSGDAADPDLVSGSLLPALIRMDAAAAVRLAESLAPGPRRTEALRLVAQLWTSADPEAALAWAGSLRDPRERSWVFSLICIEIAGSDPARAVQEAERVGLGEHADIMLPNLVQRWAARDLPAAKIWAMAKPAGEPRDQMLARLALVQCVEAPAEAARFVVDEIPTGPVQGEAVMSVIHQWAIRDPTGAAAWVGLFPPGEMRERAEREISGLSVQNSP